MRFASLSELLSSLMNSDLVVGSLRSRHTSMTLEEYFCMLSSYNLFLRALKIDCLSLLGQCVRISVIA